MPVLTFNKGISRDSFQDRIQVATKKFKDALRELLLLKTNEEFKISKEREILYNGFYRKSLAAKAHGLFKIDPKTNKKIEVTKRSRSSLTNPNNVNPTLIHAWSIVSTPVPDIMNKNLAVMIWKNINTEIKSSFRYLYIYLS